MPIFLPQSKPPRAAERDAVVVELGRSRALRVRASTSAAALRSAIALRALYPLVSQTAATTWAHLTVGGEYRGHPMGAFAFDARTHGEMLDNFARQANPLPLTYEHEMLPGMPRPAAGWVHELEVRDGGLWGRCELTERAAALVRAGEYRYTSVVFAVDGVDRKTGERIGCELIEVALTNTPFVDGQTPLSLEETT